MVDRREAEDHLRDQESVEVSRNYVRQRGAGLWRVTLFENWVDLDMHKLHFGTGKLGCDDGATVFINTNKILT